MSAAGRSERDDRRPPQLARPLLAGASFTLAVGHLAVLAYLDLLRSKSYEWIISGPEPFDAFGSGPFQLWFHVAFGLAAIGLVAVGVALLAANRGLLVVGLLVAAVGVVAGPSQLFGRWLL